MSSVKEGSRRVILQHGPFRLSGMQNARFVVGIAIANLRFMCFRVHCGAQIPDRPDRSLSLRLASPQTTSRSTSSIHDRSLLMMLKRYLGIPSSAIAGSKVSSWSNELGLIFKVSSTARIWSEVGFWWTCGRSKTVHRPRLSYSVAQARHETYREVVP